MTEESSLTSNEERAKYARAGFLLTLPLIVVSGIFVFLQRQTIKGDGGGINITDLHNYKEYGNYVLYVQIAVSLFTWISFIGWAHRAYKNLRALGMEMKYESSFVIWAWFIPIVNLIVPPIIIRELQEKTPRAATGINNEKEEAGEKEQSSTVGLWWLFNLLSIASIPGGIYTAPSGGDRWDVMAHLLLFSLVSHLCQLIAYLVVMDVLKGISADEQALFERVEKQLEDGTFVLPGEERKEQSI